MINQTQLNRLRALLNKNKTYLDQGKALTVDDNKKYSMSVSMTILMEYFSLNQNEAFSCITDSGNDNKIDAFYFNDDDDELGNLVIIQSKYKQKDGETGSISEDEIKICIDSCKKIVAGKELNAPNKILEDKIISYRNLLKENDLPPVKIQLFFATNGVIHDGFKTLPEVIDCQAQQIFPVYIDATNFGFINSVEFGELKVNLKNEEDKTDSIFNISNDNFSGKVVSTSIESLMEFYRDTGERLLLNNNVRYLIKNSHINKEIQESFINDPEKFCYLNNGVTIISSHFEAQATGHPVTKISLTNPSVVNGGQTIATLYNLFTTNYEKYKDQFQKANILIRIYKSPYEYAISIAQATNTQNPINIVDLKANDQSQTIAKAYLEKFGIGLIVKLGEDISYYIDTVTNEHLLQVYASLYADDPAKAKTSKGATFKGYYDVVFNPNIDEVMCKKLHRCYQISKFLNDITTKDLVVIKNAFYSLIYTMKLLENNLLNQNIPGEQITPHFESSFASAYMVIESIISKKQLELKTKFSMNNLFKGKDIKSLIDLELESQQAI